MGPALDRYRRDNHQRRAADQRLHQQMPNENRALPQIARFGLRE